MAEVEDKKPRAHNAEATKQRILGAAKDLFSQQMYSHVTTRDIAARAGINIALINRYFGSKRGLFAAVVERLIWRERKHVSREESCRDCLNTISEFLSGSELRRDELRLVLLSALDPEVKDIVRDYLRLCVDHHAALLGGDNALVRSAMTFSTIMGVAMSSFLLGVPGESCPESERMQESYRVLVESLIDNRPPATIPTQALSLNQPQE